jgi:crotonobetainyl-CoA:carnitine CoA-transferase CaiB-like acyl-CoA transferase
LTHWLETLGSAGIPVAAVMSLGEVMASPHSKAEGLAATVKGRQSGESFIVPRIPIRVCDDAVPGDAEEDQLPSAPLLGENTEEVLRLFGFHADVP